MKKIDDTPVDKNESEDDLEVIKHVLDELKARINQLHIRIANLETQRTPQDENDDPEWFS